MRLVIAAALLLAGTLTATGSSKGMAKVQLPCESEYQELSPSGTQLAVWCKDHSLRVVNVPEGGEGRAFPAGQRPNTAKYSPDGGWLAVGFIDGMVEVVPSRGTAPSKRWKASERRIDALQFFPNGKTIVVGPVGSPAEVWDLGDTPVQRASLPFEFGGMTACAVSPDGKVLIVAGEDTTLSWYDTATWRKTHENSEFLLETFALAFSADGRQVMTGGADSRISMLDTATAKAVRQLPPEAGSYIVAIDLMGDKRSAVAVYLDGAGEKPPHQLIWDLTAAKSVALKSDAPLTCGGVINGKLWGCSANGNMLTLSQYE